MHASDAQLCAIYRQASTCLLEMMLMINPKAISAKHVAATPPVGWNNWVFLRSCPPPKATRRHFYPFAEVSKKERAALPLAEPPESLNDAERKPML
jgi:hypothetical protein